MSSRAQELLDQAAATDASGALMSPTTWNARSSKDLHYRFRKTTRRRKP